MKPLKPDLRPLLTEVGVDERISQTKCFGSDSLRWLVSRRLRPAEVKHAKAGDPDVLRVQTVRASSAQEADQDPGN
jgi:hypothetical protein